MAPRRSPFSRDPAHRHERTHCGREDSSASAHPHPQAQNRLLCRVPRRVPSSGDGLPSPGEPRHPYLLPRRENVQALRPPQRHLLLACHTNRAGVSLAPTILLFAGVGVWRNLCLWATYMFLTFARRCARECVDKMAVQVGPFPGVSGPLAYSLEALSITRLWRMSLLA
jgi:hypothetical protein